MKKISKIVNKCQFSNKEDLVKVLSWFLTGVIKWKKLIQKETLNIFPTD